MRHWEGFICCSEITSSNDDIDYIYILKINENNYFNFLIKEDNIMGVLSSTGLKTLEDVKLKILGFRKKVGWMYSNQKLRVSQCPFDYECIYCKLLFPKWAKYYPEVHNRTSAVDKHPCTIMGTDKVIKIVKTKLGI